eukprot:CAMPEP_0171208936 /NCGR_PEP_ID=MMETSP0790-20130122/28342_1 /TAXON_ID=2925 /ORGANISM="Alexandrium catenella, Strain OF101" /LENGTH=323 /DNA_ID=CAMNT_0011674541 /DNA_START=115 /DNA_END=1086 /DNA_ORIENTATION=-
MWFSFAVIAPIVLLVSLVEREVTIGFGIKPVVTGPAASEEEPSDETAHIQKPISQKGTYGGSTYTRAPKVDPGVRFFKNKDVLKELPKAPQWMHPNLRGVFWLDQRGSYGFSNLQEDQVFADLVFTYGGHDVGFDNDTHSATFFTSGTSWTWFNSAAAYATVKTCQSSHCGYKFNWNLDYTECSVIPFVADPTGGAEPLPTVMITYKLTVLTPDPTDCPPLKDPTTHEERSKCAFARRDTTWALPYPPFKQSVTYFVYKIGDENHAPTPYLDHFLEFANQTSVPDSLAFKYYFGQPLPVEAKRSDVQMVGTRDMLATAPKIPQ